MITLLAPSRELDARVHAALGRVWPADRCPVCGWPLAADLVSGCVRGNCSQRPVPTRRADEVPEYTENSAVALEALEAFLEAHPTAGFMLIGPDPVPNGRFLCSIEPTPEAPEGDCEGASIALAIAGALIEVGELVKAGGAAA